MKEEGNKESLIAFTIIYTDHGMTLQPHLPFPQKVRQQKMSPSSLHWIILLSNCSFSYNRVCWDVLKCKIRRIIVWIYTEINIFIFKFKKYIRKSRIPETKLRIFIQQLTANGHRHARGPVPTSYHYMYWKSNKKLPDEKLFDVLIYNLYCGHEELSNQRVSRGIFPRQSLFGRFRYELRHMI